MELKEWARLESMWQYMNCLRRLTEKLPPERWSCTQEDGSVEELGILKNYLRYTFSKLFDEREAAPERDKQTHIYMDDYIACFDMGLFDKNGDKVYSYYVKNDLEGHQEWLFRDFVIGSRFLCGGDSRELAGRPLSDLRRANYLAEPSALVFNVEWEIRPNWDHILGEDGGGGGTFHRLPEALRKLGKNFCRTHITGELVQLKKRIQANYKTTVPQWYEGGVQLLAPLYLMAGPCPDVVLTLSQNRSEGVYYGKTLLTLEMAYKNARLIARPDSDWLQVADSVDGLTDEGAERESNPKRIDTDGPKIRDLLAPLLSNPSENVALVAP
ncbi:MAG: DUF3825 domain-containing protein [Synergistaceae bacterium]|nr:DUF3825 domain-containing protein [Synergistaceae bacterium]